MTPRPTRTQRLAMPLAREVVRDLAVEHGGCIRPVQLRRTDLDTGQVEQVLVPCGHTLAIGLPLLRRAGQDPAGRAVPRRLAPGHRTRHHPRPADDEQRTLDRPIAPRPSSSATRPSAAGQDTAELDELAAELDEEITRSGLRGNVLPARPARGGTARPGAARTPPTCPGGPSPRARSARPTPRRTARLSGRRCSSP